MMFLSVFVLFFALCILELVWGFVLSQFACTHKHGIYLWALSGLFVSRIPKHCKQNCDGSCRLWNCPNYCNTTK